MLHRFAGQHVVMLQGPAGPFFRRVAGALAALGAEVTKVNLNPGDALFFRGPTALCYRGTFEDWPGFVEKLLGGRGVDSIMLLGDCRPYHRAAIEVARRCGVQVWVFEEGYIRPDFLTLEPGGVNGNSSLPRDPEFYRRLEPVELPEPRPVGRTFWWSALWAALHALACTLFGWRYPHYRHHRDVNAFRQAALWARAGLRKLRRRWRDRAVTRALEGELAGRYFFVPLQVQGDHQLVHAPFHSIAEFIEALVTSFARHAPRDALLVLKHHPMDRAYTDYTELVRRLCRQHAVEDRVWYVDAVHLPTCLKHARGTVVMNSTVGLSSLYHQTPTKCLGTAVYDIPGLTHQGPLDRFWTAPGAVDEELRTRFVWWVRTRTQLNGTVWTGLLDADPARPDEAARPAPHSSPAESG